MAFNTRNSVWMSTCYNLCLLELTIKQNCVDFDKKLKLYCIEHDTIAILTNTNAKKGNVHWNKAYITEIYLALHRIIFTVTTPIIMNKLYLQMYKETNPT